MYVCVAVVVSVVMGCVLFISSYIFFLDGGSWLIELLFNPTLKFNLPFPTPHLPYTTQRYMYPTHMQYKPIVV